ncbi:3-oxoacyl-[acyl-carrier-protein] synthase-3 [Streptomyces puniciscabiei]|uniref:3-oxoacyl-[acyl-carrier-protein] synthase-3 n=1 Tax=Streptomyces puniciscabiei TaxID=164348 RepID=A0A542UF55_9ACTN|nr:ketoacyl-ACP synthase III [Streptomyces puniciscabiei]TQK97673.1 3-oxoacyl-[acyl-carrier-protein] synthase-3 [Streptomyces puniciscabiei]
MVHAVAATRAGITAGIREIGICVPERVVTNQDLERTLDTSDEWIRTNIGVETRRYADADDWTSDLGSRALLDACGRAGVPPASVDLVICGTYTPDRMLPSTAVTIMGKAGISGTPGFDVNSGGCPGSVYALEVGANFIASGAYRRVAVVLSDVNTKIFDPQDRTVAVIFGDAAACYLLEPVTSGAAGIGAARLGSEPSGQSIGYVTREPRHDANGERRQSGFGDNFTVMVGRGIRDFVLGTVPGLIEKTVADAGLGLDDIDFYALHQANRHMVHSILDTLGQPREKTLTNIQHIGNTSGASVPLVLRDAVDAGRIRTGDRVLLAAFGAGLNYGALVARWCGPEDFA